MQCDHDFHTALPKDGWPLPESGWWVYCEKCGRWAIQPGKWVDDFEEPSGNPILMTEHLAF